ncbi:isoleucine--tRNA ligase [Ureaplasma miroungigenitalium]|uniref:Isoleucine--tRNA ligase n=1 Tax=Ureaplasma miroungigenitalium TaxID=1042321 RepID=A0ABT3BND7_9BACT|nr:isoleucine--tRNA ligase [Ureaplasma miroungigenitalium]MCV3728745.1 isoleucine--tRNA ligase [Ureaplasma miroungigenitalium]MCV3734529.1 isoleucine--tRNA ligase [Ureaplasma miroungigenitalium]
MKDYKSTLNMPQTAFEMKANLNTKEPVIQQEWLDKAIYQQRLLMNAQNKSYVLHDGPPYANGNIHIGHALNKILKDIIIASKNMQGFYAPYIPGWDTHGLPIEVALAKKVKLNNLSVNERRDLCAKYALEQVANQTKQFMRLGLFADFKEHYLTLNHDFQIDQLQLFLVLMQKGYVYQDFKPVFWSWSSQSALAESEIEYNDRQSHAIYVAMPCVPDADFDDQTAYVIWTTTPWTLPANQAICIHPYLTYALVQVGAMKYIIAANLVDAWTASLGYTDFRILKTFKAHELENKQYYSAYNKQICPIIMDEYVSDTDGSGLVHNAPGFGLEDYYACKKYDIKARVMIDQFGKYNQEVDNQDLVGVFYEDANAVILESLKADDLLLDHKVITHSVAHDWRTKKPVMYRATKQWFVSVQNAKDDIIKTLENDVVTKNPRGIERIKEMIINRKEWCISRQRVWGVPIPMIFDQDDNPIYDDELTAHIIQVLDEKGLNAWFNEDVSIFLTPKYKNTQKTYYKEQDIMDVWFDSGSSYSILQRANLNYPADLYLEGYDQYRGWFNSSLITGTIFKNKSPYKTLLAHGMVLDGNGLKMSKSKGNVTDPLDVCQKYGADVLRLWVSNIDYENDSRISDDILKQTAEIYRRIRNTLFKYSLSVLADFNPSTDYTTDLRQEEYYVLNEFKKMYLACVQAYNDFNFMEVIKNVNKFILELSGWYFDLIKDSLYCLKPADSVRKQIQSCVYFILKNALILLTPIIPHTCEEAYQHLNANDKKASVKLENFLTADEFMLIEESMIKHVNFFFDIKDTYFALLEQARKNKIINKNNEAIVFVNQDTIKCDVLKKQPETLARWLNVAQVVYTNRDEVAHSGFLKCQRCWNYFEHLDEKHDDICVRCAAVLYA